MPSPIATAPFAIGPFAAGCIAAASALLFSPWAAISAPLTWSQKQAPTSGLRWSSSTRPDADVRPPAWRIVDPQEQRAANPSPEPAEGPTPASGSSMATTAQRSGPVVMAMSRGITVNRTFYPDVALTVPSGFKRDPQRFLSLALDGTNQVRRPNFQGCRGDSTCADAELNLELALLQAGPASVELLYNVANIDLWSSQGLGFRAAVNVSPTVGIAIGGESLIDLDNGYCAVDTDCGQFKGRTLYAVASVAIPLSQAEKPPVLTLSAGAGNGYYGFNGSGASDSQWGPFGSISYAFNEYVAVGVEYSGYAFSGGISLKPFKDVPLTGSLYITDFLGNFPSGIENYCYQGDCDTRVLGRLTYSF